MLWRASIPFLALAACRPSSPRAADPPAVAAVGDAGPSGIPEGEPAVLTGPADVACTFAADDLNLGLAIDGESPTFGNVISAKGTLTIAPGAATRGAFLEHARDGVHARGWVPAKELAFYLARPTLFAGWLAPREGTSLRWVSAADRKLELEIGDDVRDDRLTTVTFRGTARGNVACSDLAFASLDGGFDTAVFALQGRKGTSQHVRPGEPIPIAREPGGTAVAEIQFSYPDAAEVFVVERRGSDALVVIDAWGPATLYGWISDSFFAPSPAGLFGGLHTRAPTVRYGKAIKRDTKSVDCDVPVRILAEVAGRRAFIGQIDPHTSFMVIVDERNDRFANIEFRTGLHAHEGARISAERSALAACRTVTPR